MTIKAVVIGASAGGIEALLTLLPKLPSNYALPIIIVVHLSPDKDSLLSAVFGQKCMMRVREAEDKEIMCPGSIYFAPPNYHLLVESPQSLALSCDPAVLFSRPAIDVLFESASEVFGPNLMGIILTGASSDGAKGLKSVYDKGGVAVVQNPEQASVSVMPQAAYTLCPNALKLHLTEIAELIEKAGAAYE